MSKKRKLVARWDKREEDVVFIWPTRKTDGHLLHHVLASKRYAPDSNTWERSLLEELERRGYDITTFRFEIALKDEQTHEQENKP